MGCGAIVWASHCDANNEINQETCRYESNANIIDQKVPHGELHTSCPGQVFKRSTISNIEKILKIESFQILREYWKLKVLRVETLENKSESFAANTGYSCMTGMAVALFSSKILLPLYLYFKFVFVFQVCICISILYLYLNFVFVFKFCICISILYLYLIFCLQFCLQLRYDFVEQGVSGDEREVFQSMMASSFNFPEFLLLSH